MPGTSILPARRGSAWMRPAPNFIKRIAVCISGEFRHVHHRVPEQQVRQLLTFLAGVDCDVFIHGWHSSSEPLILNELKPKAYKFEPRPQFGHLAERIRFVEPNIKPQRDEGSLSMFYALQQSFSLLEPTAADYSHVLRLRPDIAFGFSLLELLTEIENNGSNETELCFPHLFHSKGINDQIAFGRIEQMRIYCRTFSNLQNTLSKDFFNPETALLRNLISHRIPITFAYMPYALMREVPIRINTTFERFQSQLHVWWSRTEWLPLYCDLSRYFEDKLRAVDDLMKQRVPDVMYLPVGKAKDSRNPAVIRTQVIDNDPAVASLGLVRRFWTWWIKDYRLQPPGVVVDAPGYDRITFVLRETGGFTLSEWRMDHGVLHNERLYVDEADAVMDPQWMGISMSLAHKLKAWSDRFRR